MPQHSACKILLDFLLDIYYILLNYKEKNLQSVVFWLVNTSSNNKTNHDMWGK